MYTSVNGSSEFVILAEMSNLNAGDDLYSSNQLVSRYLKDLTNPYDPPLLLPYSASPFSQSHQLHRLVWGGWERKSFFSKLRPGCGRHSLWDARLAPSLTI